MAFFFEGESAAAAAREELARLNGSGPEKIELAPLSVDEHDGTILALAVEAANRALVEDAVLRHGGRIVADVPEDWL